MRAGRIVVGARRNQLDGIATEDHEVADVLFPPRHIPRVVGICLGPVTELVPAQPVPGRRRDAEIVGKFNGAWIHPQTAKKVADPEYDPARIVADDEHHLSAPGSFDANPVTLGSLHFPVSRQLLRKVAGP